MFTVQIIYWILMNITGSHTLAICFRNIVNILKSLPEEEVLKIAEFYFEEMETK